MCGIFAYVGDKDNAGSLIIKGLKLLEYRGYDSWGVALKKKDGSVFIEKHTGKIGGAKIPDFNSGIGFGHTRWATHGGVTDANAHPHTDCTKKVIIVHNGIVENFTDLKKELLKQGHTFSSETDTEVIAHLIEQKLKDTQESITFEVLKTIVLEAYKQLHGMSAIIVFFPEYEQFFAIKNGSPLVFGVSKGETILASDSAAIAAYTKQVYFFEDYELLSMNRNSYELYTMSGEKKDMKLVELQYEVEDTTLGVFPHYMIKEISEQPKVIQNIIDTQKATISRMAEVIKKAYGTYFIGCGSAYHVALAGSYLFSKIAKRHVNSWSASEFSYLVDFLKNTSLVVAISQSGETMDVISSVKQAKSKQAQLMALTNVLGSTLYRLADHKVLLNAGPEICVLSTKVVTAKLATLLLIAHNMNGTLDKGITDLSQAIHEVKELLSAQEEIKKIAKQLANKEHIFILGRGLSYPTALEANLKIKEVSYIHAEGFAAGDLKHGVIALIEKGTPVIIYNPEDETYEDTLSSANEVKARGAYVIGVSSKENPVYDEFIHVNNCNEATIIPNIVVSQLLGYHLALVKDLDPDKPRNLAKSVTVK